MTEEALRIRSYLAAQGAKLAPAAIIEKVRGAMDELHTAMVAVPAARFNDRPTPEEWSANEVMAHVVDAGARFGRAIEAILDGGPGGARLADRIEGDAPRRSPEEWWVRLSRDRETLFAHVRRVDPGAFLDRTIEHPFFGPLDWRATLLFFRLHDLDHAGQLAKIAAAVA